MISWRQLKSKFASRKPPVISTMVNGQQVQVTEWARVQAAANMAADPEIKQRVIAQLESQYPGRGEQVARERYPEAGWK